MEEVLNQILTEVRVLNNRVGNIEDQLGSVDGRLSRVEDKLGSVDGRLSRVEDELGRVEGRLGGVENRVSGVEATLQEHTQILRVLEHRTDVLNVTVIRLEENMNSLTGEVAALRQGQEYLIDKFMEHDREIWALKKAVP